jgi:hypothetical protein
MVGGTVTASHTLRVPKSNKSALKPSTPTMTVGWLKKKRLPLCVHSAETPPRKSLTLWCLLSVSTRRLWNANVSSAGELDFNQFTRLATSAFPKPEQQDGDLRKLMQMLDHDDNGRVSEAELRQLLITVGEPLTHQEVIFFCSSIFTLYKDGFTVWGSCRGRSRMPQRGRAGWKISPCSYCLRALNT